MSRHLSLSLVRLITVLSLILTMLSSVGVAAAAQPVSSDKAIATEESAASPQPVTAAAVASVCTDPFEPDDTFDTASSPTLGTNSAGHRVCSLDDRDWYQVSLTGGKAYQFSMLNVANGANTSMILWQPGAGGSMADGQRQNIGGVVWDSPQQGVLVKPISVTGLYYLEIQPFSGTVGETATYDFNYVETTICPDVESEPDNDASDAVQTTVGSTVSRAFCASDDQDWLKVDLTAGQTYEIESLNLAGTTDTNLFLYRTSTDVNPLHAHDDRSSTDNSSILRFTAPETRRYLLQAIPGASNTAGHGTTFDIRVQTSSTVCPDAALEADEQNQAAASLDAGTTVSRAFCETSDVDVYTLTNLLGNATYTFQTQNAAAGVDPLLYVFDSNDQVVAQSSTPGTPVNFTPTASGTYHLSILDQYGDAGAGHTYDVRYSRTGCMDSEYETTADNVSFGGRVISLASPVVETRAFCDAGESDWYRFSLTAGNTYEFKTSDLTGSMNTYLTLYDGNGTQLAFNDNADGLAAKIIFLANASVTYILRANHASSNGSQSDTFLLSLTEVEVCVDLTIEQGDPDNSSGEANAVGSLPFTQTRAFCTQSESDWFSLNLVAGRTYTFATSELTGTMNTWLVLTDSNGTQLASSDNVDGGLASRIVYIPDVSGLYRLQGYHASGFAHSTNSYRLSITDQACVDEALELEGDNSSGDPRTVTLPVDETRGFCTTGDQDWYRLDLAAGNTYEFRTANLTDAVNTYLVLQDENGTQMAFSDNEGGGLASIITYNPDTTGTYYLRATHASGTANSTSSYQMLMSLKTACADAAQEAQGDDSSSDPRVVTFPVDETRAFCRSSEQDWYEFTLTAGNTYEFKTSELVGSVNTYLLLQDANSTQVAFSDNEGGGLASIISYRPDVSGTYRLRVTHASSTANSGDTFRMQLSETAVCADAAMEAQGDNGRSDPRVVNPHVTETRAHCVTGDQDWYQIDLVAGNVYTFQTTNLSGSMNTYLSLQDGSGTQITASDNVDGGLGSRIVFTPNTTGIYFLVSNHASSVAHSTSSYDLTISVVEPTAVAPTVAMTPSVAVSPTGWFKQNVTITLRPADTSGGSGLESWSWSVSGAQTQALRTPVARSATYAVTTQGETTISWTATDYAQNTQTGSFVVRLDKVIPTIAVVKTPAANAANWNTGAVTLAMTGSDDRSGVWRLTYSATGAQPFTARVALGASKSLSITAAGVTTVTVFATDNAGNVSATRTVIVRIDKVAPAATASASPTAVSGDWRKGPVAVTIAGSDATSGVASVTYSATGAQSIGSTTVPGATATFNVTVTGTTTITYTATDRAGRTSAPQTLAVMVDGTRPIATAPLARVTFPSTLNASTTAVQVKLTWSGSDADSGLNRFQLQRSSDNGATWLAVGPLATDTALTITRSFPAGSHLFRVRAFDNVGLVSDWMVSAPLTATLFDENAATSTGTWTTDSTIPNSFGGSVLTSSTAGDTLTFSFTGKSVALVAATDRFSGIVEIYRHDSTTPTRTQDLYTFQQYGGRLVYILNFTTSGPHTVTIKVKGTKRAVSRGTRAAIDGFVVIQ